MRIFALTILLFVTALPASANMSNDVMKSCLAEFGYSPEKFDTFAFNKASACFHDWKSAETQKDYSKMREFLEEHPWYKGKNWQWEQRAEYTCTKRYDLNGIVVCHKPYYLN